MEGAALYRLMAWLSPAFPVGAFSYSHGLEWAVETGDIHDAASLHDWLDLLIRQGSGLNDAVLFVHAHRAATSSDWPALAAVAELAAAFTASRERLLETTMQGEAFAKAIAAAWPCDGFAALAAHHHQPIAYPVAVAIAAAGHGIGEGTALAAYLHAFAANLISAAVRLVPLGQTDGARALAALEPAIMAAATHAASLALDDMGSAALRADLASLHHETQYTRLFRT